MHAALDQNVCGREPRGSKTIKDSQMIPVCEKAQRTPYPEPPLTLPMMIHSPGYLLEAAEGAFNHLLKPRTHPDQ